MSLMRFVSPGLFALAVSIGVTVGSLYVTISAASGDALESEADPPVQLTVATGNAAAALQRSTVQLTGDNRLVGRVSTILAPIGELQGAGEVSVVLVPISGDALTTVSGPDGVFEFKDVQPGVYTVNAHSEVGGLSIAIRLVRGYDDFAADDSESDVIPVARELSLQLDVAMASADNLDAIDDLAHRANITPDPDTSEIQVPQVDESEDTSSDAYLNHSQIRLQPNGTLHGHVSLLSGRSSTVVPVEDLRVNFIQNGVVLAATEINPDGSFIQENLLPGIYAMVVVGKDGIGYLGVDVVGGFAQQNPGDKVIPVAGRFLQESATIGMVRGNGADGPPSQNPGGSGEGEGEEVADNGAGPEPEPSPGGGEGGIPGNPGGGVGGGGGGVGGGSGFGELLGLAGAALGAAALANDDSSPASPGN